MRGTAICKLRGLDSHSANTYFQSEREKGEGEEKEKALGRVEQKSKGQGMVMLEKAEKTAILRQCIHMSSVYQPVYCLCACVNTQKTIALARIILFPYQLM